MSNEEHETHDTDGRVRLEHSQEAEERDAHFADSRERNARCHELGRHVLHSEDLNGVALAAAAREAGEAVRAAVVEHAIAMWREKQFSADRDHAVEGNEGITTAYHEGIGPTSQLWAARRRADRIAREAEIASGGGGFFGVGRDGSLARAASLFNEHVAGRIPENMKRYFGKMLREGRLEMKRVQDQNEVLQDRCKRLRRTQAASSQRTDACLEVARFMMKNSANNPEVAAFGTHIGEIIDNLVHNGPWLSESNVRGAVTYMIAHRHIYTAFTEHHYKIVE